MAKQTQQRRESKEKLKEWIKQQQDKGHNQ